MAGTIYVRQCASPAQLEIPLTPYSGSLFLTYIRLPFLGGERHHGRLNPEPCAYQVSPHHRLHPQPVFNLYFEAGLEPKMLLLQPPESWSYRLEPLGLALIHTYIKFISPYLGLPR